MGTKLLVIITKMGLSIQDRGAVVRGAPVVKPGDDLFWFGRPKFILFLIHLVLFQVSLTYLNQENYLYVNIYMRILTLTSFAFGLSM